MRPDGPKSGRVIRRSGKVLTGIAAAILTPLVLVVVVFVALVAQGQLSLSRFTPQFEEVLSGQAPGLAVGLRDAVLAWDGERGRLQVRVVGVELRGPDGDVLARFPQIALELSTGALLDGRIEAAGVELLAADVHLVREADGQLFLQAPEGDWRWPLAQARQMIDRGRGDGLGSGVSGGLARLSARDGRLTFLDVGSELRLDADDVAFELSPDGGAISISLTAVVDIGGARVPVGLGAVRQAEDEAVGVSLRFRDLPLSALPRALPLPALAPLSTVTLAAEGEIDLDLSSSGELSQAEFDVAFGPGQVALPEMLPLPLQVSAGTLRTQVSLSTREVSVEWAEVLFADGLRAQFVGALGGLDGALWARGEAVLSDLPAENLAIYWPPALNKGARRWVVEHVYQGFVPEGRVLVDIRPGELQTEEKRAEMVQLDWRFEQGAVRYFAQLPHLINARGRGRVTARDFSLDVEQGTIADVVVDQGRLTIDDFKVKPTPLDITFRARGPVASVLAVIDEKPLRLASRVGIVPATAAGDSTTLVRLRVPLKRTLRPEEVEVTAQATLDGYGVPSVLAGLPLSDGALTVDVDNEMLQASGTARINGIAAEVEWRRPLQRENGARDEIRLATMLDKAGRDRFGLAFGDRVAGPAAVEMVILPGPGGSASGQADVNLEQVAIDLPEVKWRKQAGDPGRLQLAFAPAEDGGLELADVRFSAADLQFTGTMQFALPLALQRAEFREVSLGESRLDFDLQVLPDGGYRIDARGDLLDLRHHMQDALDLDEETDAASPAVDFTARFDAVRLSDDIRITRTRAAASRRNGEWRQVDAGGAVNDGAPALLRIAPVADGRLLELRSDDAGAMARALGLYDGAVGGRMQFLARLPDMPVAGEPGQPQAEGEINAENFRLVRAPVLAQVLTLGSLAGVRDLLRGDGINMVRLRAPFTFDRGVLTITDARAVGPALGLTATLSHDRNSGEIDADGTVVPSYTINSVLGRIPLIGDVFVGREGEGVFAVTYKVEGPIEEPQVTVNPLSALATGFLRNIVTSLEEPLPSGEMIDLQREVEEQRELK